MNATPQEQIDAAKKLIESEQAKIAKLEIEQNRASSDDPRQVASFLHQALCTQNHTDGCSFGWGRYDNPRKDHHADQVMQQWLKKAEELMVEAKFRQMTVAELVDIARLVTKSHFEYR
jgi:hypothetical protein